jgi:hypothetical protein
MKAYTPGATEQLRKAREDLWWEAGGWEALFTEVSKR